MERFINLYDDEDIECIIPANRLKSIVRGPKQSEDDDFEVDQYITVNFNDATPTLTLTYEDEYNCDEAFEHFCSQLGAE